MIEDRVLAEIHLFASLAPAERAALARVFRTRYVRKLDPVYEEGAPAAAVYVLVKGWVELTRRATDGERVFRIGALKPGDAFGIGEMCFSEYFLTATALSECTLLTLDRDDFHRVFMTIPALNTHVVCTLSTVVRQRILMLDWDQADQKLVQFLFFLAERYGEPGEAAGKARIVIRKRITQEKMAEILGLSREHVVRLFRRLEDAEVVARAGSRMIINKAWLDSRIIDKSFSSTLKRSFFSELDALEDDD